VGPFIRAAAIIPNASSVRQAIPVQSRFSPPTAGCRKPESHSTFAIADWQRILCSGFFLCQDTSPLLPQPVYYCFTPCILHVYIWYSQNCVQFWGAYPRHESS
jgi:hypothetical protein